SKGQTGTTFDAFGILVFGQTYYWRVDEVDNTGQVIKGSVWSFTVEPYSYELRPTSATASSSHRPEMGPDKTIDRSGLDASDQHGTGQSDMWLSSATGPKPDWISYQFDNVYKLHQLWVWNSNQSIEGVIGFGAKDVLIEASQDGDTWTEVGTYELAQAPGETTGPTSIIDLSGVVARYIRLTVRSNWGAPTGQSGLSEVRFYQVPVRAFNPTPADGASGVALDGVLSWRIGREVAEHHVYLGMDKDQVGSASTPLKVLNRSRMGLGDLGLQYATTYYWRVDEVNQAASTPIWVGPVWSFSTIDHAVVDDFESYDNTCRKIFFIWSDGFGHSGSPECNVAASGGNGTGSVVGYGSAPYAERTIVHGGSQSMPFEYDNTKPPYYSEATRIFDSPQDWTVGGVDTLTVYLRGNPAAFVELSPGEIVMNGKGADIWNTADEFRFVYKQLTGNGSIIARVDGLTDTDPWSKAGVMIRETLDAGSVWAAVFMTGNNGVRFQSRPTTGGSCTSDSSVATAEQIGLREPVWVKLERIGNQFNGYYSVDGVNWTSMVWNPQTITMANQVYIGLAVTSHNTTLVAGARFSGVSTSGNVVGVWQVAEIGATAQEGGNSLEGLYLELEDWQGGRRVVVNGDPAVVASGIWERWDIPLKEFSGSGMRLDKVKRLTIGIGSRNAAKAGGKGMVYIDDIQLTRLG
ncbi:MAG: discoidin domain-containing protein, partial [Sedimentisphaerales bacterium]|nr:discoidin domain-containing protein [Sedimentisphaerales bacterium]